MVLPKDVVEYARSKLNQKVTVSTNPYGGQCVAFNDYIIQHFTNGEQNLAYTNAKDTLSKAKQQGLEVIYNDHPDKYPQPGDSIVYDWGTDPFGHIGIVIEAGPNILHTLEQNVDGWRDENGNGENDQTEYGGGGYVREMYRDVSDYQYVTGWFRLKYTEPEMVEENKKEEEEDLDMFIVGAKGRGIALMQGGHFLPFLHKDDPLKFLAIGVKNVTVDTKTFDEWQKRSGASAYDDDMIVAMDKIIKELKQK